MHLKINFYMKYLFALGVTLLIMSCNNDTNDYTLEGTAEGFENGAQLVVFSIEGNQPAPVDTLVVTDGKFKGTYPKTDSLSLRFIRPVGATANILFFPEDQDLTATIYKDSLTASYVTGGPQNEAYREFAKGISGFNKQMQANFGRLQQAQQQKDTAMLASIQKENMALTQTQTEKNKKFVEEHPGSLFSVMLISEMVNRKDMTPQEARTALDNLEPKVKSAYLTQQLEEQLSKLKVTDVGEIAPSFEGPTPTGETLALKDAMGKYTLIDFWASWCKPCRLENPNVVKVYNQYHDKGFNIISVSLDRPNQKEQWLKAIEDDKMDWYHISNLQFWQDPIAQAYSIRSIPTTLLLDEEGRIIAKNLRGAELENKIASLLGN